VRDIGHQQRGVAAVGDTAHLVSPRRQVTSERGNHPESERSGAATCRRRGHRLVLVSGTDGIRCHGERYGDPRAAESALASVVRFRARRRCASLVRTYVLTCSGMATERVSFRAGRDPYGDALWIPGSVEGREQRDDGEWLYVLPAYSESEDSARWVKASEVRPLTDG
jgi:hypothetical protein